MRGELSSLQVGRGSFKAKSVQRKSGCEGVICVCAHTDTQTHRHRHTQTHAQTHAQTHTDTDTHRHTDTRTHTPTHTDTHRQTHTHTHTDTQTHTHTHRHTHTHHVVAFQDLEDDFDAELAGLDLEDEDIPDDLDQQLEQMLADDLS